MDCSSGQSHASLIRDVLPNAEESSNFTPDVASSFAPTILYSDATLNDNSIVARDQQFASSIEHNDTVNATPCVTPMPSLTTQSSLSPAILSVSNTARLPQSHKCGHCSLFFDHADVLIDHIEDKHARYAKPYHCGVCLDKIFTRRKDFETHLTTTKAHGTKLISCNCGSQFRKDHFLGHMRRKRPCHGTSSFYCPCNKAEVTQPGFTKVDMVAHVETCRHLLRTRRPGRPRKSEYRDKNRREG